MTAPDSSSPTESASEATRPRADLRDQMLQQLDRRKAGAAMAGGVPLAPVPENQSRRLVLIIGVGAAAVAAALFLAAGLYQFSPLKQRCLAFCRSPDGFILSEWRDGAPGAAVMGFRHGLFCLGCCWALMALLFVGGIMNLLWIAGLSVLVLLEKVVPCGEWIARAAGLACIAAALSIAGRAVGIA